MEPAALDALARVSDLAASILTLTASLLTLLLVTRTRPRRKRRVTTKAPDAATDHHPAPWERRPREGARAFEAFALYRDMGPQRSLDKVRAKLGKTPSNVRLIQKWSSTHGWVRRAQAWDDEQDRLAREATQAAHDEIRRRHLETAKLYQDALKVPAQVFLERVARGDPSLVRALNEMDPHDLLKLVALSARAAKAPVAWELVVTGQGAGALGDEAGEDAKAIDELAQALEAAARERRGVAARARK